jgi:acetolactate synthase-1/2/3 large subunit
VNGAESLMRTAAAAGIEVCFTNPGTTEMHLVGALEAVPAVRAVLGLFEGVCTGAADGYARMAGKPALTLLHLGPGFANGIANLHNARRANSPVVNLIGDHSSWHVANDPPLASDVESLARPVSCWVRAAKSAASLAHDGAEAIAAARRPPGGGATLIVPSDCAWGEASGPAKPRPAPVPAPIDPQQLARAARALRSGAPAIVLLGGPALREAPLREASRLSSDSVRLFADTFVSRMDCAPDLPRLARLPYFPEQAAEALAQAASLVLIGTREPVAFFGYPGGPARPAPAKCDVIELGGPEHDARAAIEALCEAVGAPKRRSELVVAERPARPTGALTPQTLGAALAAVQPEGAIVMNEAATSGFGYEGVSAGAPPHAVLGLTGGAIGQGLPCATGAAIACPDRPVIAFQADGSGLYTLQALWTQAREALDVTTLICANRQYRILRVELARADVRVDGPVATRLTSLAEPAIDWVALARGMGVPGARAEDAETLVRELERAFAEPGPHLIEAIL